MPDTLDGLKAALADLYAVERELGHGGMATVYLAQDLKHHRPVALKVLKPELAAALGPDRFLREIEVTAGLHHPHILPLYDSGRIGGSTDREAAPTGDASVHPSSRRSVELLYYVMPFVQGENLRDRLERERQLPLEEALQLTREVAEALSYAHSHGVIHRDIKPENILLESGHALVADFGIAKAVTEAGGERLTTTGISIGTPAYMSPEQASGRDHLDGRSDLYSLGCVLYEMLAGHPPFTGTTAHELLARHATDPVPPLRTGRATIPEPIDDAVERVLAKVPADRFATAQEFSAALTIDARAYRRWQRRKAWLRWAAAVAGGLTLLLAGGYATARFRSVTSWKREPVDPNIVAVLPFEVTGASEQVRILEDGIQHLLFAELGGQVGPRAVDIGSLTRRLSDWQARGRWGSEQAPVRLAASFNAGLLLDGAVVEAGARLLVNALLRSVPSGDEVARASIYVDPDSVNVIAGRLLVELLGQQLGEERSHLQTLAGQDPEAVRAYLAGVRAFYATRYREAIAGFDAALARDSSFALAAYRLIVAAWMGLDVNRVGSLVPVVRGFLPSLSDRDRAGAAALMEFFGNDPASTHRRMLAAQQQWVSMAEQDPVAWLELAFSLYAYGAALRLPDWQGQADRAFSQAWALDSVTPLMVHRQVLLAQQLGHIEWLRRVGARYLAVADTTSEWWRAHRWTIAVALGDSHTVRALRARAEAGDPSVVTGAVTHSLCALSLSATLPLDDCDLVADGAWSSVRAAEDSLMVLGSRQAAAAARGRVRELAATLLQTTLVPEFFGWFGLYAAVTLLPGYPGLAGAAASAAESLRVFLESGRVEGGRVPGDDPTISPFCILGLYSALQGDTASARGHASRLAVRLRREHGVGMCPMLIEALVDKRGRHPGTDAAMDSLERLAQLGPVMDGLYPLSTPLLIARLHRERGDYPRALAAVRARWRGFGRDFLMRAPLLKEEAELAGLTGDTATAIRLYRQYLTFRTDPDSGPTLAEVDSVRTILARLVRAGG